jgi:hypothetical protein
MMVYPSIGTFEFRFDVVVCNVDVLFTYNDDACIGRAFVRTRLFVSARVLNIVKSLFYYEKKEFHISFYILSSINKKKHSIVVGIG